MRGNGNGWESAMMGEESRKTGSTKNGRRCMDANQEARLSASGRAVPGRARRVSGRCGGQSLLDRRSAFLRALARTPRSPASLGALGWAGAVGAGLGAEEVP